MCSLDMDVAFKGTVAITRQEMGGVSKACLLRLSEL